MKTPSLVLALAGVFSVCALVRADYEIKIASSPPVGKSGGEMVMKIKGSKIRMDMGNEKHVITDLQSGSRFVVDDQKKLVTDLSSMYQGAQSKTDAPLPKATATGKKEKIGDYEAEEYTYTVANDLKIAVWVAPDYPKDKAEALRTLMKESPAKSLGGTPDLSILPGPVIRTVVTYSTDAKTTQTDVKSVTEVSLEEKEFEIPKDYKVRKPPLPPGLQGKGK